MGHSLAGVVLAAGAGSRLTPLTRLRPKPLCPVGTRPLVDHALDRVVPWADRVAVNLFHGAAQLDDHLPADLHRSFEPEPLGTAGALGWLRSWIDGADLVVTNADAYFSTPVDLAALLEGWDRERTRLLCTRTAGAGDFGGLRYCGVALIPGAIASGFAAAPSGLYEVSWRQAEAAGRLDLVVHPGVVVDCGTPADYLRANLLAGGGASVVDPAAVVHPSSLIDRSVVWDRSEVRAGEELVQAIRAEGVTVLVR